MSEFTKGMRQREAEDQEPMYWKSRGKETSKNDWEGGDWDKRMPREE